MPIGAVSVYTSHHRSRLGFWVSPTENPVKQFNSVEFKQEFNDYIERKRNEDRWYKITWFQDKENFKDKIFKLIDRYEDAKLSNSNVEYFRNKIAKKLMSTAYAYGGMRAQEDNSDGSEMSKILMKWYHRIIKEDATQVQMHQIPTRQSPRKE